MKCPKPDAQLSPAIIGPNRYVNMPITIVNSGPNMKPVTIPNVRNRIDVRMAAMIMGKDISVNQTHNKESVAQPVLVASSLDMAASLSKKPPRDLSVFSHKGQLRAISAHCLCEKRHNY